MLAQNDNVIEETCETVYKLNQDKEVRYLCEMREEGQRILRTYQYLLKEKEDALAESTATIAAKSSRQSNQTSLTIPRYLHSHTSVKIFKRCCSMCYHEHDFMLRQFFQRLMNHFLTLNI